MQFAVRGALILVLLTAVYGILSFTGSYARAIDPSSVRSFNVSGQGEVVASPDVAIFTFGILTEGGVDIAGLQDKNSESSNAAIAYLKEQGIEEKDIKTQYFNISPRYEYTNCFNGEGRTCPPPKIVGYTIRQDVQVKVRDLSTAGELISGVVQKGANTVSQLSFSIDDPTSFEQEAREKAFTEAEAKAKALAKAGGFKLGKLLAVSEGYNNGNQYRSFELSADSAYGVGGAVAPKIEAGSQEIRISVNVQYEIR